ncbi:MAG: hypothetical protein HYW06_02720 [Gemmatimonadetes bacterium]|nr:hypothetical protein [Gemmatimonadota bacterium]MBI2401357.1 hypothetical protein [Gemmatimonadota bacterium]MBI2535885.1 hypothetical protein [Gemmatimonadota bacterium]
MVPRILHAALTLTAILIIGVFVALARVSPPPAPNLTTVLRAAAGAEILTVVVLMKLVSGQIEALRTGEDAAAWWAAQGPRAIVLWALAEATAAIGGVFWYLARDPLLLVGLGGFGLGALVWMRPGKLVLG